LKLLYSLEGMAVLISAHGLKKSFGARPLFEGLTFSIDSDERIGLIGPNGAGKSTLLRILASRDTPDSGELSLQKGLRVGFLEQVPQFLAHHSIRQAMSPAKSSDWDHDQRLNEWVSRLELDRFDLETPVERLSGGWKKRVALARELVAEPDLLLLDEPTNHLDVESILWLEGFLARARLTTLTITHDRAFLMKAANRIIEIDPRHPGGLLSVKGDYVSFLEKRDQLLAAQERREVILKNTLRREVEWLRQGAKARTTKQQARIQRAEELQSEVSDLSSRNQSRTARLDFGSASRSPKKLIEAQGLSKSFGERLIFSKLDLRLGPGTRLGLLGTNGSGKSTLIRVLLGTETASLGEVFRSDLLQVASFDQNRESLDPSLSVSKTVCPSGDHVDYRGTRLHVRSYLDRFLFSPQQMEMAVGKLSGGEQARLLIARLMLRPANLLVLDEPTNDLDMATLAVLEECLNDFDGAIILVSHDRFFLGQVCNQILAFPPEGGSLVAFADLSQWEAWHEELQRKSSRPRQDSGSPSRTNERSKEPPEPAPATKKKKLSYKDQRDLDTIEERIAEAETKLAQLTEASADPKISANAIELARISKELAQAQSQVDGLYQRWQELLDA
jgi:ATP-binding cassette subfamily F protein uup